MNHTGRADTAPEDLPVDMGDKRRRHIAITDNMPGPLRACVHEFGFSIVNAFTVAGIKDPDVIRHLVHTTWTGAREAAQKKAPKNGPLATLDWVLAQSGSSITALTLWRICFSASWAIVPTTPTVAMIDASMEEVSGFDISCTKHWKHRRRIEAAIKAFAKDVERHVEVSA
jgi:hypothetical protein